MQEQLRTRMHSKEHIAGESCCRCCARSKLGYHEIASINAQLGNIMHDWQALLQMSAERRADLEVRASAAASAIISN